MLYKYSNHFKFVLMIIAGLLASSMTIVMAYMVQTLTNIATEKKWNQVGNFLLIVLTGYVLSFLASLVFNRLKTSTIKEVNTYLRIHIFKGMLNQSVEENTNSLGFLTSDFKLLETNRFNAQIEILMQGCTLLMALGYALVVNWLVTLLFLVGSFVPMLVSSLFQKAIQSASENWTKANSDYVNQTKNFLAGSQTLRLYGKQDNATKKNQIQVLKLESALRKMNLLDLDTGSWINLLASSVTFLVPFLVGIYMVIKGLTTLGALFAIVQLANSFVNPILIILEDRNKLSTTKKIVEKINTYLTLAEKKQNKNKEKVGDLTFTDIALKRKDKQFIEGLNLTIKVGSKQAIIGPSGMGKSTLLQFMMYGSFGKAEQILLNQKLKKAGTFTDIFAYASQASVIFADSLWFNLTLGANIARDKVLEVCEKLDLISLVKEKGFEYYLGNNADQLSGGQLERIELARAILANRPILLLDEINASLDKKTSDEIHQYLLNSNLTFVEVIHHYNNDELSEYDGIIDLNDYRSN
ncbi:ATP-binding cassette domain-containing protein [Lactobacillus intestinalis]|uniref:ATP-binding cassette domain-containing protein n=1 Tax=Lactobacillus intestinalis TaxID=151781 RepID=UPI0025A53AEE|nr:ABC transporter ATP-binding protein [Lactobacillus intestinalis]